MHVLITIGACMVLFHLGLPRLLIENTRDWALIRPLKLDDKVLVGARMRFWSRIKNVCHLSFLVKKLQEF
jgi:hypothetical protein